MPIPPELATGAYWCTLRVGVNAGNTSGSSEYAEPQELYISHRNMGLWQLVIGLSFAMGFFLVAFRWHRKNRESEKGSENRLQSDETAIETDLIALFDHFLRRIWYNFHWLRDI